MLNETGKKKNKSSKSNIITDNSVSANGNKRSEKSRMKRLEISSIKGNRSKLPVTGSEITTIEY